MKPHLLKLEASMSICPNSCYFSHLNKCKFQWIYFLQRSKKIFYENVSYRRKEEITDLAVEKWGLLNIQKDEHKNPETNNCLRTDDVYNENEYF